MESWQGWFPPSRKVLGSIPNVRSLPTCSLIPPKETVIVGVFYVVYVYHIWSHSHLYWIECSCILRAYVCVHAISEAVKRIDLLQTDSKTLFPGLSWKTSTPSCSSTHLAHPGSQTKQSINSLDTRLDPQSWNAVDHCVFCTRTHTHTNTH